MDKPKNNVEILQQILENTRAPPLVVDKTVTLFQMDGRFAADPEFLKQLLNTMIGFNQGSLVWEIYKDLKQPSKDLKQ